MSDPARFACEAVSKADYDRYLAAMMAPARARAHLFALYAFNHEVAKTAENVREPIAGAIRLQWWRDAIGGLYAGEKTQTGILPVLSDAIAAHDLPHALFETLIEAREHDLDEAPFKDLSELEAYADTSSGNVMRLAARILGADESLDRIAGSAGVAYALAGLLRALPYHAAQRRLMLPEDMVKQAGLSAEEIFSGPDRSRVAGLIGVVTKIAAAHLSCTRQPVPRCFLPALLPASLVTLYLKELTRHRFDLFQERVEVPIHRRQIAMLGAAIRGRL